MWAVEITPCFLYLLVKKWVTRKRLMGQGGQVWELGKPSKSFS